MKEYSKHVMSRTGVISTDTLTAMVDGYTFQIGEVIPYRNSRGNICYAQIVSFKKVDNGSVWFNGQDEKTKAKVWYGLHCSLEIQRVIDNRYN